MRPQQVAVVGAGIGGLAAALALSRAGWKVAVYEQAPVLAEVGAGLTVSPNATRCLLALGVGDQLRSLGSIPEEAVNLHYRTGEILVRRPLGTSHVDHFGAPYYHVHRADLHTAMATELLRQLPGAIRLSHQATGVIQTANGATIQFANGSTAEADLVIAADGVRSSLRGSLFGSQQPTFTHRVAWRAVVPVDRIPVGMLPAKMGSVNGPDRTLAFYLMRNDQLLNVVFMSRWDEWVEEDWRALASVADVRTAYAGWCDFAQTMIDLLPPEGPLRWGLFDRPPTDEWSSGRTVFMGDAVHPMLPYLGQGAAMAMEDAIVLARALELGDSYGDAFAIYKASRKPRTDWVQALSKARADFWEKSDTDKLSSNAEMLNANLQIYPYDAESAPLARAAALNST